MVYTIYEIKERDVHVPSEDYYSRGGSQTETIKTLVETQSFATMEEAINVLEDPENDYYKGEYTILPVFTKK